MEFPAIPSGVLSFIFAALRWIRNRFVMSIGRFGEPHSDVSESDLKHIHVPVVVESGLLGSDAIPGVEPWITISDGVNVHKLKLLWRNENDSDTPFPNLDLRAGRTYHIPVVARSTTTGLPLSGRAVTNVPAKLYADWVLTAGVPRITDGNHYFTFTNLTNLGASRLYSIRLELHASNGKVVLVKTYFLHLPQKSEPNDTFRLEEDY
jgi:hypothetical protein